MKRFRVWATARIEADLDLPDDSDDPSDEEIEVRLTDLIAHSIGGSILTFDIDLEDVEEAHE